MSDFSALDEDQHWAWVGRGGAYLATDCAAAPTVRHSVRPGSGETYGAQGIQARHDVSRPHGPHDRRIRARMALAASRQRGAPNVLFIVIDDTGFGQLGCYGSPIATPNIDKLAKNGLLFNNMHTTALCSPSRSCMLTGRNHHSNAMSCITEGSTGFPGRQWRDSVRERLSVRRCFCSRATRPIASASGT